MPFSREYRLMSFVPRWSIVRKIKDQNIAEHSFFVVLYASQLCDLLQLSEETTLTVLTAAIYHDTDETFTGDIPGPSKREMVDATKSEAFASRSMKARFGSAALLNFLSAKAEPARSIIKCADLIDECMYLATEYQMGNVTMRGALDNARQRLEQAIKNMLIVHAVEPNYDEYIVETIRAALKDCMEGGDIIVSNNSDIQK